MRLNCSELGKSLFVASTATLALVLASSLSVDFLPVALAQGSSSDPSNTNNVSVDTDGSDSKLERRQLKRARRAQENAAAQASSSDPASSNGPSPSSLPRFDGPRHREFGAMKRRLGKDGPMAGAMGGPLGGAGRGMGRSPLDLSQLNLTDEQKAKITEQRSKTKVQAKELQGTIKAKRAEMRDMMFDPTFSPEQIRAKRQELRKVQDQAELLMLNDFLSMRAVLTPEQVRKMRPNIAARNRGLAEAAPSAAPSSDVAPDASAVTSNFANVTGSVKNKNK